MILAVIILLTASRISAAAPADAASSLYAPDGDEVLLTFRYRGVGNVYVTGFYDYSVDKMFLPVTELFSLLQIYYDPSPGDFSLSGNFLHPNNLFRISFSQFEVVLSRETYTFSPDDFRIGEMDFFASPRVFEEVFGMNFTVNMNALTLSLETDHTMPIEEAAERERARQLIEAREVTREYFPLPFERDRRVLGFGFADYNISGNFTQDNPNMNYNVIGGAELLGGDLQGSVTGSWSEGDHNIRTSNLRWRYVVRDNPWFSNFQAGQLSTTGLQPRSIRGASISNDPIEPRRIYETYIIDGNTEPDSEVELYLNNRLIDFRRADAAGYYRFEFPLTYGSTQLTINIYTPTGEVRTIDRRLQIPFTFLPPGEVAYNIQGGQTETFLGGADEERFLLHGNVAMGVTDWLTAKVGSEYIDDVNDNRPFTYGSLSARVWSQYLMNVDIAPDAFYRGIVSVMYPRGSSFSLQYTKYADNPLYTTGGADQDIQASFFVPFTLFNTPMGFRVGGDHRMIGSNSLTRYRTDLSIRLGRMNLRTNYRDVVYYSDNEYSLGQGLVTTSLTYTFMRSPGLPVFVRGMFLRGNISYSTASNEIQDISLQMTRSIRQSARVNLEAGYDLRSEQHLIRLGFIMDLNPVRSTTNVDMRQNRTTVRQNFRGSIGLDRNPDRFVPVNRNQVGRAGASVILFIDNNNSGTYDEGDEIIPHRAVRLDRSAQMEVGRDGIIRISQLQSYFRYNMEVLRQALPNPLLAPGKDRFSFVADPNQYKRIEIPFYRTGVIDGTVYFLRDGEERSQGGLRLLIRGLDNDFEETVRNFSDGSYYAMDMPPGMYTIEVDPSQLSFLDAYMPDGPKVFEIRARAEGDFIEDLDITIKRDPDVKVDPVVADVPAETPAPPDEPATPAHRYVVELNTYVMPFSAERAASSASETSGQQVHIRKHDTHSLHVVYAGPYQNMTEAQNMADLFYESGFPNAFIRPATEYESERPTEPEPLAETIELTTPDREPTTDTTEIRPTDQEPITETTEDRTPVTQPDPVTEETREEVAVAADEEPAEDPVANDTTETPALSRLEEIRQMLRSAQEGSDYTPVTERVPDEEAFPFEEAGVGDHYYIVLDSFSSIYRAETARARAKENVGGEYYIRYLENDNLYMVFSVSIEEKGPVKQLYDRLTAEGFTRTDVLHGPPPGPAPMRFQVQLASFGIESEAREVLETANESLSLPLTVEQDDITGRYSIRTEPYATIPEAREALKEIRSNEAFRSAFLISNPRIPSIPVIHTSGF